MRRKLDFSRFKKAINLTQYAASVGYVIDRQKSTKSSIAMRHASGDKVIISRRGEFWVYFSAHDETDNGTIVDFIAKRTGKTWAEIGQELDYWLGEGQTMPSIDPASYIREVPEQVYDRERVKRLFQYVKPVSGHPYLEIERKISREVLASPRFAGRLFTDRYGNVVFPHFNKEGLCGLELKNADKGVLTRGSEKGLWMSRRSVSDTCLVISESGIDGLSYHDLFRPENTAYAAVSGSMNENQLKLTLDLLNSFPNLHTVILAVDHDQGGESIARKIERAVTEAGRFKGTLQRHIPEQEGQDWNGHLTAVR